MKPREAAESFEKLKKDLASGNIRKAYLLFGSERYLRNFYEKKLLAAMGGARDDMNTNIYDTSPVSSSDIIDQAQTMPFFAENRVIVVRYSGFFKKNPEDLANFLSKAPDTTKFIFVEDEADARLKIYKQVSDIGLCVEFTTQPDKFLLQNIGVYLKNAGKRMSQDDATYLIDVIGTDMGKLVSELEKLVCFAYEREVITREDIDIICSKNVEDRIFEMIDAIMKKDMQVCMDRYEDLLALKIQPARIIVMLEKQFLWMLQLKSMSENGYHLQDIIETIAYKKESDPETGAVKRTRGPIGEYQVKIYLQQASPIALGDLQKAVSLCETADEDFKSGRMNERLAAEALMVKLCKLGE